MRNKQIIVIIVFICLCVTPSCIQKKTVTGNLIGVVLREGTGKAVPNPVLIVEHIWPQPLAPDRTVKGDEWGRFAIDLTQGRYKVRIGTKMEGPFYIWPYEVPIEGAKTTIRNFLLPEGY